MSKPYKLKKSTQKAKKYMAIFDHDKSVVHFGDPNYGQYKDTTGLGLYSKLDHLDKKRRDAYYTRHGKDADKWSAKWFSHKYLWGLD